MPDRQSEGRRQVVAAHLLLSDTDRPRNVSTGGLVVFSSCDCTRIMDTHRSEAEVKALVQISTFICTPGLVKFVPAVARLFCLALSGSFLTMFAQNKVDFCILQSSSNCNNKTCAWQSLSKTKPLIHSQAMLLCACHEATPRSLFTSIG